MRRADQQAKTQIQGVAQLKSQRCDCYGVLSYRRRGKGDWYMFGFQDVFGAFGGPVALWGCLL